MWKSIQQQGQLDGSQEGCSHENSPLQVHRLWKGLLPASSFGTTQVSVCALSMNNVISDIYWFHDISPHIRRARHGGAKIACPVPGCGSKFTAMCNLATHRKRVHEQKSTKREVDETAKNE